MRLTNRRHGSKIDLQMTSMIDCVFLLLIFFMVTSSFARTERELDTGLATETRTVKAAGDLAPERASGDGGGALWAIGALDPARARPRTPAPVADRRFQHRRVGLCASAAVTQMLEQPAIVARTERLGVLTARHATQRPLPIRHVRMTL